MVKKQNTDSNNNPIVTSRKSQLKSILQKYIIYPYTNCTKKEFWTFFIGISLFLLSLTGVGKLLELYELDSQNIGYALIIAIVGLILIIFLYSISTYGIWLIIKPKKSYWSILWFHTLSFGIIFIMYNLGGLGWYALTNNIIEKEYLKLIKIIGLLIGGYVSYFWIIRIAFNDTQKEAIIKKYWHMIKEVISIKTRVMTIHGLIILTSGYVIMSSVFIITKALVQYTPNNLTQYMISLTSITANILYPIIIYVTVLYIHSSHMSYLYQNNNTENKK